MGLEKKIVIIAGPNGAGKTAFAQEFLPNEAGCLVFVNADLIAAGLSPFQPETVAFQAGRLMRVRQGGHNVPSETIRRRFRVGRQHFLETYRHLVNFWEWFDNSGDRPVLLDEGGS